MLPVPPDDRPGQSVHPEQVALMRVPIMVPRHARRVGLAEAKGFVEPGPAPSLHVDEQRPWLGRQRAVPVSFIHAETAPGTVRCGRDDAVESGERSRIGPWDRLPAGIAPGGLRNVRQHIGDRRQLADAAGDGADQSRKVIGAAQGRKRDQPPILVPDRLARGRHRIRLHFLRCYGVAFQLPPPVVRSAVLMPTRRRRSQRPRRSAGPAPIHAVQLPLSSVPWP